MVTLTAYVLSACLAFGLGTGFGWWLRGDIQRGRRGGDILDPHRRS